MGKYRSVYIPVFCIIKGNINFQYTTHVLNYYIQED